MFPKRFSSLSSGSGGDRRGRVERGLPPALLPRALMPLALLTALTMAGAGPVAAQDGAASRDPDAACAPIEQAFEDVTVRLSEAGRGAVPTAGLAALARRQGTLIGLHAEAGCDPAPLIAIMRVQGVGLDRLYRILATADPGPGGGGTSGGRASGGRASAPRTEPAPRAAVRTPDPPPAPPLPKPRVAVETEPEGASSAQAAAGRNGGGRNGDGPVPLTGQRRSGNGAGGSGRAERDGGIPVMPGRGQARGDIDRSAGPRTGRVDEADSESPLLQLAEEIRRQGLDDQVVPPPRNAPLRVPPQPGLPTPTGRSGPVAPPAAPPPAVVAGGSPGADAPQPATSTGPLAPEPADAVPVRTGPVDAGVRSGRSVGGRPAAPPPAVTAAGPPTPVGASAPTGATAGNGAAQPSRGQLAALPPGSAPPAVTSTGAPPALSSPSAPGPGGTSAGTGGPGIPSAPPPAVLSPGAARQLPVFYATTNVNLRQGPSTDTAKIGLLEAGAGVAVLGRTADGKWLQIQTREGQRGFAYASLMSDRRPGDAAQGRAASDGPPPDGPELVAEVKRRAVAGDREAQFALGNYFLNLDMAQAVRWWRVAADGGHPGAQYNMGLALMTGRGVEKNQTEALSYWRAAAAGGHQQARSALAQIQGSGG